MPDFPMPIYVQIYKIMQSLAVNGEVAAPPVRNAAAKAGINPESIKSAVNNLVAAGFVEIARKGQGKTPAIYRVGSDDISNRPHLPNDFSEEDLATIIQMFHDGASTRVIGERIGRTKNSIVGKVHRLQDAGILESRPNPVDVNRERKTNAARSDSLYPDRAPTMGGEPLPVGGLPLPPLASEMAAQIPPVVLAPVVVRPRSLPGGSYQRLDLVPTVTLAPMAVAEGPPPAIFSLRRTTQCNFPMWGDRERPSHVYCHDDSMPGIAYCHDHALRCYPQLRRIVTVPVAEATV